jgi:hypothetical protein
MRTVISTPEVTDVVTDVVTDDTHLSQHAEEEMRLRHAFLRE